MANMSDVQRSSASGVPEMGLVIGAGLFRLLPHLPNFTPVGALGLLAGARMRLAQALLVPLVVMAVSDLLLQWLDGSTPFHPFVYASMVVNVVLGRMLLSRTSSPWKLGSVSLLASVQFFLITNLGVWLGGTMYAPTLAGLTQCYVAGLPFFQYTLLGDLTFCGVLFGAHAVIMRRIAARQLDAPNLGPTS